MSLTPTRARTGRRCPKGCGYCWPRIDPRVARDDAAAADAIDEALAERDEWDWDSGAYEVRYLCEDCLDEDAGCPRCNGDGAAFAATMRNAGVLAV